MYSKKRSVLLVDDEPLLRELIEHYLVSLGHRVTVASTGSEAMALWESCAGDFEVLITDYSLSDSLTGSELGKKLLTLRPDLQVTVISGYDLEWAKRHEFSREMNFLQKPFPLSDLQEIVERKSPGLNLPEFTSQTKPTQILDFRSAWI